MAGRTTVPSTADQDVPPPLVKFGQYPSHHGGPGVVRGPGRSGVPVRALSRDRFPVDVPVDVPRMRAVAPARLVRPPPAWCPQRFRRAGRLGSGTRRAVRGTCATRA